MINKVIYESQLEDKKVWIFERVDDTIYKREFLNYDEPRKKVRTVSKSEKARYKII